ncbi:MAG: SDR family oxidoreductase [Bacteroidales bacterium]|nr:SDR family oxidoreductase [Bacteroidales bacterium]
MTEAETSYCIDLQTIPNPEIGKILVSGTTGYIGGRLVKELMMRGYEIRILVRSDSPDHSMRWPGAEIFVGDALNYENMHNALKGVKVAYYLIHSLLGGTKNLEEIETKAALNFRRAAEENGVERIIYLGGLGDKLCDLSTHLTSRYKVAEELGKGKVPVTILRAAIIIGSGSASFEILENLVKNAPVMLLPGWANTYCQPIGIRDVIKYLVGVLELEATTGKTYDIGGRTTHTYAEMIKLFSRLLGKKKVYINVFISDYKFFGYIASLLTPVPAPVVMALFEGMKNEVICINKDITKVLNFEPLGYSEAIILAQDIELQDQIGTRWSDAYPPTHDLELKLSELKKPKFISTYSHKSKKTATSLFKTICTVGSMEGWFKNNWMWRLRGAIDKILMGVGTSRGRRSNRMLRINDVIGFWRVENLQDNKRLLLRAEMKLPGKAWLEFNISSQDEDTQISVTAYFQPKGLAGYLYWYFFVPFHAIIFKDLIKDIEIRS